MRLFYVLISVFVACASSHVSAQERALDRPEISESGRDYLKAVRYRRVDTEVQYYDPTQPAPPLDTTATPDARPVDETQTTDNRRMVAIVALIVLVLLIAFVYFSAGRTSVSFRSASDNARRRAGHDTLASGPQNDATDLDAILNQRDRDLALVGLAQFVLTHCLTANKVLFKRSWTHREALRSLPQNQWYIPDLHALVLESERVHFGHRSISETDFDALLARIRPILQEVRA